MMRTLVSAGFLAVVLLLTHGSLLPAAEFREGKKIVIKAGEVIQGDLYASGQSVLIEGTVSGDLIVAAQNITIKGTVEGDLNAAGQTILIEGKIYDDARLAGEVLKLAGTGRIGGDLIAAGASLECEPGSEVAQEGVVFAEQTRLAGKFGGDFLGKVANCSLEGEIEGDADIVASGDSRLNRSNWWQPATVARPQVPVGMSVGPNAKVGRKLTYSAFREAKIEKPNAIAGGVEFQPIQDQGRARPASKEGVLAHLKTVAPFVIFSFLAVLLMPRWTREMADTVRRRPVGSILGAIVGFFGFIILTAVVIGATIAGVAAFGAAQWETAAGATMLLGLFSSFVLIGGYWIVILIVAPAVASTAIGRLLLRSPEVPTLFPFLLGLVLLVALTWIPIAGAIIGLVVVVIAWGAFCVWLVLGPPDWDSPSAAVK